MKTLHLVILALALSFAANAFATCPTPPSGSGPYTNNFSQDQGCFSTTGSVSSVSVTCYTGSGWSFGGTGQSYVIASFTADGNYIINANNWTGSSFIYLDSPNSSAYDSIELVAVVTHNGFDSRHSLFFWDGTMGGLNGCAEQYGIFSAVAGDTVSIRVYVSNSGSGTIEASVPRVLNSL